MCFHFVSFEHVFVLRLVPRTSDGRYFQEESWVTGFKGFFRLMGTRTVIAPW